MKYRHRRSEPAWRSLAVNGDAQREELGALPADVVARLAASPEVTFDVLVGWPASRGDVGAMQRVVDEQVAATGESALDLLAAHLVRQHENLFAFDHVDAIPEFATLQAASLAVLEEFTLKTWKYIRSLVEVGVFEQRQQPRVH